MFKKRGIDLYPQGAKQLHPAEHRIELLDGQSVPYDYLVIATGPDLAFDEIEGFGPEHFTQSVCHIDHALKAKPAFDELVKNPGPVIIGAVQGASCFGPAYEFAFILGKALRDAKVRDRVPMTFVTSEPYIGHLGLDSVGDTKGLLESAMRERYIKWICNAKVDRFEDGKLHVTEMAEDGSVKTTHELPFAYSMMLPAFRGVEAVRGIEGLTNPRGFILADKFQRNTAFPDIFSVGVCVAIPPIAKTPVPVGVPKTGFMIESMVTATARNIASLIAGDAPSAVPTWNAVCLADFGDTGVVFVAQPQIPPRNVSWSSLARRTHHDFHVSLPRVARKFVGHRLDPDGAADQRQQIELPARDHRRGATVRVRVEIGGLEADFPHQQVERLNRHLPSLRHDAEQHRRSAFARRRERLRKSLGHPGAFERHVDAAAADRSDRLHRIALGWIDRVGRPQPLRQQAARRLPRRQHHRARAGEPRKLHHDQPDHPATQHRHAVARLDLRHVEPVQTARQRLRERPQHRIEIPRQDDRLTLRHTDIFGEAAVARHPDRLEIGAEVDPPLPAGGTMPAGDVGVGGNAVAGSQHEHALTEFLDDAAEFVPQRHRQCRRILAAEHVPVRAADACRLDPDDHLARSGPRPLHLFGRHLSGRPQSRCLHRRSSLAGSFGRSAANGKREPRPPQAGLVVTAPG